MSSFSVWRTLICALTVTVVGCTNKVGAVIEVWPKYACRGTNAHLNWTGDTNADFSMRTPDGTVWRLWPTGNSVVPAETAGQNVLFGERLGSENFIGSAAPELLDTVPRPASARHTSVCDVSSDGRPGFATTLTLPVDWVPRVHGVRPTSDVSRSLIEVAHYGRDVPVLDATSTVHTFDGSPATLDWWIFTPLQRFESCNDAPGLGSPHPTLGVEVDLACPE